MSTLKFDDVKIDDTLPPLTLEPVNRTTLALFAGASGDHNRVHIDTDYARKAGMPDVFAHGMLSMAYLGRLLTRWVDQRQLREFGVRFVGITHLGHQVTCTGRIVDKFEAEGERRVKLEIQTANQYGEPRVVGEAVIAL
ncbi:MaoC family dehydratase [Paraburkholderia terrae]|uniref:Dehydratase n=1 Tax=Paraburkholderia terrae TaxID=311230 RepID=A0A2I8EGP7_9BURK|nr:MaoC family dehydratase [Paraburkholderia terrae]AUT58639.1 dehydratase [Paraburkholderia terrae]